MTKKTLLGFLLLSSSLFGLGFGGMGNTSAGLGNSGVALRKSAWGIYYNPALLASDNRGKFGYSFGIDAGIEGLDKIINAFLDFQNSKDNNAHHPYQIDPKNTLAFNSQNGLVIQITGGTQEISKLDPEGNPIKRADGEKTPQDTIEKRSPYGAFTMATFLSAHLLGNTEFKEQNSSNGGGGSGSGGSGNQFEISGNLSGLALLEIPIGWGWRFETAAGDISVGTAIKYMKATGLDLQFQAIADQSDELLPNLIFPEQFNSSDWFGIDLGLLYTPIEGLNIGFVAKNINSPSFDLYGKKFTINPQFRLGFSYEFAKYFALTFDSDLAPNRLLFENSPKTQMLGGGLLMDFKYIDLRFGVMGDMANKFKEGVIMTGGINLLGFLDLAIQASSSMFNVQGYKIPKFISLKVGGSFTF